MHVLVVSLAGQLRNITLNEEYPTVLTLKTELQRIEGIPPHDQRLTLNSKELKDGDDLSSFQSADSTVSSNVLGPLRLNLRLCGGKGGFGSLLRGGPQGVTIKKTINFDACRDLSGRRLRHVNNENRIAQWLKDQKENQTLEAFVQGYVKKQSEEQKVVLHDNFADVCEEISKEIQNATEQGIQEQLRIQREDFLRRLDEFANGNKNNDKALQKLLKKHIIDHEGDELNEEEEEEEVEGEEEGEEEEEDEDDSYYGEYVSVIRTKSRSPNTSSSSPSGSPILVPSTPTITSSPSTPINDVSELSPSQNTNYFSTSSSVTTTTTTTTTTTATTPSPTSSFSDSYSPALETNMESDNSAVKSNEEVVAKETENENSQEKEKEKEKEREKNELLDLSQFVSEKEIEGLGHKVLKKQLKLRKHP